MWLVVMRVMLLGVLGVRMWLVVVMRVTLLGVLGARMRLVVVMRVVRLVRLVRLMRLLGSQIAAAPGPAIFVHGFSHIATRRLQRFAAERQRVAQRAASTGATKRRFHRPASLHPSLAGLP
jgi:biopolymer transport protein ExbB/TolQ